LQHSVVDFADGDCQRWKWSRLHLQLDRAWRVYQHESDDHRERDRHFHGNRYGFERLYWNSLSHSRLMCAVTLTVVSCARRMRNHFCTIDCGGMNTAASGVV